MDKTVDEAKRYVNNAKELLREKAGKENGVYRDRKYVRLAGHAAYLGVLVALDGLFQVKKGTRKSVEWYQEQLRKTDRKLLDSFNAAYDTLHLAMGYDGNISADVSAVGITTAESIINWVETRTAEA
ncbi:hypothetical protein SAMN04487996_105313 [Dyadobacter soli]|uniref:DUF5618 domain-containing protein n=1 Tax=Dyadobacter soli TaxID=659014 RepID=A0A1G7DQS1_9BACT|nr:DUF5618 family protein [Dyadobacter soli]SDE53823.1 hypothetical protein SAMN04487996_105313 [Dyadobacter soli]